MKRIAFVAPWYGDNIPGGAEAALRGITDHLFAAGMDIEILTTTVENLRQTGIRIFISRAVIRARTESQSAVLKSESAIRRHLMRSMQS